MNKEQVIKLIQFLKENGCFRQFMRNTKEFGNMNIKKYIMSTKHNRIFTSAFVWQYSPEGHNYWAALADEWDCC